MILTEAAPPFSSGSTQLEFHPDDVAHILDLHQHVDPAHLTGDGFETEPHCTVRYGIAGTPDYRQLMSAVSEHYTSPITLPITGIEIFKPPKPFEVIVIRTAVTPELLHLRELVENTQECEEPTFPDYKPHITIAYVAEGMGDTYAKMFESLLPSAVTAVQMNMSSKDGKRHIIPLAAKKRAFEATKALFNK